MSQVCQVTGKRPLSGMNVSHSHIRTKRRTLPNLHAKMPWDILKDFEPVTLAATVEWGLVVNAEAPQKTATREP